MLYFISGILVGLVITYFYFHLYPKKNYLRPGLVHKISPIDIIQLRKSLRTEEVKKAILSIKGKLTHDSRAPSKYMTLGQIANNEYRDIKKCQNILVRYYEKLLVGLDTVVASNLVKYDGFVLANKNYITYDKIVVVAEASDYIVESITGIDIQEF